VARPAAGLEQTGAFEQIDRPFALLQGQEHLGRTAPIGAAAIHDQVVQPTEDVVFTLPGGERRGILLSCLELLVFFEHLLRSPCVIVLSNSHGAN
jgi:hypothetical protein